MGFRIWPGGILSLILLIAFGLELVAVLSVPVTRKITLCEFEDYQFGVFGYCNKKTNQCSSVGIGYDVSSVDNKFSLPSNARRSLANLLIVHVVAAGLTLILFVFSLLAQFGRPGHSSRYLLFVLIFSIPTFLISLLAFLVDILLFVSHLSWGGWIVLGSTVLVAMSGVILCLMRRTLSSQKAMRERRRVAAETSELNDIQFNPVTGIPDSPFPQRTTVNDGDFTELKYETSTDHITSDDSNKPLTDNDSQFSDNNNYYHATSRAYRSRNSATPATATASASANVIPEVDHNNNNNFNRQPPPPPAGSFGYDDQIAANNDFLPSGNTYGPNVVPIPRMQHEANNNNTNNEYMHPLAQQQQAQRESRRLSGGPQQPSPPQHQQRSSYVPPRRQWQHIPGQMVVDPNQPQHQQQQQRRPNSRTSDRSRNSYYSNPRQSDHYRQYFMEDQMDHDDYYYQYPQQPQQPQHPQQQHQPYQQTRSEMIIQNNPDFQIAPPRRKSHQPQQVPQQAAMQASNTSLANSSGSSGNKSNKGMPAAFATNDSPFAVSRK